jgi:hypothetical protein
MRLQKRFGDAELTSQLLLTFNSDCRRSDFGSVSVCNLDPLPILPKSDEQAVSFLQSIFRVAVVRTGWPAGDRVPDVFGLYQVLKNGVRFVPYFPFEKGIRYRATFDPRSLPGFEFSELITLDFYLPREQSAVQTEVTQIFPSSDSLPENLLRFYARFSGSMQRGRVEEQVAIIGPDGRPVPEVLYRPPVELWDRNMQYLTILLDPGRLKRWVGPNVELGPPLKAGQEYRLVIGSGMVDLAGRPLREAFCKRFLVTEAVRESIAVERWKILPPAAKSREPLALTFPRPLDWALLFRTITIASKGGELIDGRIEIDQCEKRWSFIPTSPWVEGAYHVRIAPSIEDVCGNSVVGAFDRRLRTDSDLESQQNASWLCPTNREVMVYAKEPA